MHYAMVHQNTASESFKCTDCVESFIGNNIFQNHFETCHKTNVNLECNKCEGNFKTRRE